MSTSTLGLVVFGVLLYGCWRTGVLRVGAGFCAVMFGFFLASSRAAPHITAGFQSVLLWVSTWNL